MTADQFPTEDFGESSILPIAAGAYARLPVKTDETPWTKEIFQDLDFLKRD